MNIIGKDRWNIVLAVCSRLFDNLHQKDIPYCHWKSNEHLEAGLNGNTDLDIIVDRGYRQEFEQQLLEAGFKRFDTPSFKSHHAIEHYLGFDEETTNLVHIHLHYKLILGGDLKEYQPPWADRILETRHRDEEFGVYVADPDMEMFLLLVRYAQKLGLLERLEILQGKQYPGEDIEREYDWLQERIDLDSVETITQDLVGTEAVPEVRELTHQGMSVNRFRALRSVLEDELAIYRTYSKVETFLRERQRRVQNQFRWWSKDFNKPYLFRRTAPNGGVIVAILGPDGAGKSTVAADLDEWLSWKLDIYTMYMGSTDKYSLKKRLLYSGKDSYRALKEKFANASGGSLLQLGATTQTLQPDGGKSMLAQIYEGLLALIISSEKRSKLRNIWAARNKGAVVLTDRYPQNEVPGLNDGPLLKEWTDSSSKILRWLGEWETTPYEWAHQNPPDLVLKLDVDPETAANRAGNISKETVRRKQEIVSNLEFEGTEYKRINANQPQEQVLREARKTVWDII